MLFNIVNFVKFTLIETDHLGDWTVNCDWRFDNLCGSHLQCQISQQKRWLRARTHEANFCVFCEKNCHHFRDTSAHGDFLPHQILSSITKLQRRLRPASEQDKFLSCVKTVQILQFTRHDLNKKLLSAPTITKLKIWRRQFLLRYFVEPNKFCQPSAYGPLVKMVEIWALKTCLIPDFRPQECQH